MTGDEGRIIRVRDAGARREARPLGRADSDRIDRFRAALTELGYDAAMVGRILTARFGAAALALQDLQRQLETGPTACDVVPKLTAACRRPEPGRAAERRGTAEEALLRLAASGRIGRGEGLMLRALVKSVVPAPVILGYRRALLHRERKLNAGRSLSEVFEGIYQRNGWGGAPGEWCSGSGSAPEQVAGYLAAVAGFVRQHGVRSVVDLGCGDFRVGAGIAALGVDYTGVDIVPGLIERNNRLFASERVRFVCLDITRDALPDGDLAVVRQVFQHLSNAEIAAALARLARFGHVLITEHHPAPGRLRAPNVDKPHGGCTRVVDGSAVCLGGAPFGLPVKPFHEAPVLNPLAATGETLCTYLITNAAA